MCTVTYIPVPDGMHFVSNRDERRERLPALPPETHSYPSGKMLFPRDADAGGTWMAVHGNGNVIVFLNGAFRAHIPAPPYRRSRGRVLLDLLDTSDPAQAFLETDLENIEPFTAIMHAGGKLFECRWDGKDRHSRMPGVFLPHIWSSATLYTPRVIAKRERWFMDFLEHEPEPSLDEVMHFHAFTGEGDPHTNLRMDRDGEVFTVSITGLTLHRHYAQMAYLDLPTGNKSVHLFPIEPTTVAS
jgi:hypothetical protein